MNNFKSHDTVRDRGDIFSETPSGLAVEAVTDLSVEGEFQHWPLEA